MLKKRYLFVLFIFVMFVVFIKDQSDFLLKNFIQHQIRKQTNLPIIIGAVNGNYYNTLTISDVVLKNPKNKNELFFQIKYIGFKYNLFSALKSRDLFQLFKNIRIYNGHIAIQHYADDSFNLQHIIEKATKKLDKKSKGQKSPTKLPSIFIKYSDLSLSYLDQRGFGEKQLDNAVKNTLSKIKGQVLIDDSKIKGQASADFNNYPVKLNGFIHNNDFELKIHADEAEIADVINYIQPIKEIKINQAKGEYDFIIRPLKQGEPKFLPIFLGMTLNIKEGNLRTNWLPTDASANAGSVVFSNFGLFIKDIVGESQGQKLYVNGEMPELKNLNINILAPKADLSKADKFLPFLNAWNLKGTGSTKVNISLKEYETIKITTYLKKLKGSIFNYDVQNAKAKILFHKQNVTIKIPTITAYKGKGSGHANVQINKNAPADLDFKLKIKKVNINNYFTNKHFQGQGDLYVDLQGKTNDFNGKINFYGKSAKIFGQKFLQASIPINKTVEKISFQKNAHLTLNDDLSKVFFKGSLDALTNFDIELYAPRLTINDLYFIYSEKENYSMQTDLSGSIRGKFNDEFKKHPLNTAIGEIDLNDMQFKLYSPTVNYAGVGRIKIEKNLDIFVTANNSKTNINLHSKVGEKGLIFSKFYLNKLNMKQAKSFIKFKKYEYDGFLSGAITLFPDKNKLFLNKYGVTGNININTAVIASQNIDSLTTNFILKQNILKLRNTTFLNKLSNLNFNLEYRSTQNFLLNIKPSYLRDKDISFSPVGINIVAPKISGTIESYKKNLKADLNVSIDKLSYANISLPKIDGQIFITNNSLVLPQLTIKHYQDKYLLKGYIKHLLPYSVQKKYNLECVIEKGELLNISRLYQTIKSFRNKDYPKEEDKPVEKIADIKKFNNFMKKDYLNIYSLKENNLLQIINDFKLKPQRDDLISLPKMEGDFYGFLNINNENGFKIDSNIQINSGHIYNTKFKKLNFVAKTTKEQSYINLVGSDVKLFNDNFEKITFEALHYSSTNILEVLNLYTVLDRKKSTNILVGKIDLSSLINKTCSIAEKHDKDLDLRLSLKGKDINLLSILNNNIASIYNDGMISATITGALDRPIINSSIIDLENFSLQFNSDFILKSPLKIPKANLAIVENVAIIDNLSVHWNGEDTNKIDNQFIIGGQISSSIDLHDMDYFYLNFDLLMKPTQLQTNFKNLYIGKINLNTTKLQGIMKIPLTKKAKQEQIETINKEKESGLTLRTKVLLDQGSIILNTKKKKGLKPMLMLDINVEIGSDIVVTGKSKSNSRIDNFLTNVYVELEELKDIAIKGSLNTPDLEDTFNIKDGKIVFMNKVFTIMTKTEQKKIFKENHSPVADNEVTMKMIIDPQIPTKRKSAPYFNLKAYTIVKRFSDNVISSSNTSFKAQEHAFIIFMDGYINSAKSFSIEHYIKNNANQFELAEDRINLENMSKKQLDTVIEYLLPELLKPQFYESLLQEGLNSEQANELLRNYSASQINLWIDQQLRPVEENLAKAIGLYDIRIEHNLGSDVVKATKIFKDDRIVETDKISIQYIKDLFLEKLFIRLKTSIDEDPSNSSYNLKLTEYELKWLLNNFISINYGSYNLKNNNNLYGAFSINADFAF